MLQNAHLLGRVPRVGCEQRLAARLCSLWGRLRAMNRPAKDSVTRNGAIRAVIVTRLTRLRSTAGETLRANSAGPALSTALIELLRVPTRSRFASSTCDCTSELIGCMPDPAPDASAFQPRLVSRVGTELRGVQLGVQSAAGEQLVVATSFDDLAMV